jgi:hypothetical protein
MLKLRPPGMSPSEFESSPQGQQGQQWVSEWAKRNDVALPGMPNPRLPRPRFQGQPPILIPECTIDLTEYP